MQPKLAGLTNVPLFGRTMNVDVSPKRSAFWPSLPFNQRIRVTIGSRPGASGPAPLRSVAVFENGAGAGARSDFFAISSRPTASGKFLENRQFEL